MTSKLDNDIRGVWAKEDGHDLTFVWERFWLIIATGQPKNLLNIFVTYFFRVQIIEKNYLKKLGLILKLINLYIWSFSILFSR